MIDEIQCRITEFRGTYGIEPVVIIMPERDFYELTKEKTELGFFDNTPSTRDRTIFGIDLKVSEVATKIEIY